MKMDSNRYHPRSNPLLVCDPEPPGWIRKDPCPYKDYISMEELVTHNNLRLAYYREAGINNDDYTSSSVVRTVTQATENNRIAFRKADLVRTITGEASSPRKDSNPNSYTQRRVVQGQRNRAIFIGTNNLDLAECLRDGWLQQDAASWQESINKALPCTPPREGPLGQLPRSKSADLKSSKTHDSHYSNSSSSTSRSSKTHDSHYSNSSSSTSKSSQTHDSHYSNGSSSTISSSVNNQQDTAFSSIDSPSGYYQTSTVNYPESLDPQTITVFMHQAEDPFENNVLSSALYSNIQSETNASQYLENNHLDPRGTNASELTSATDPILAEKISNFLYRSNSLPMNVTPMSDRQKSRLETFRQSRSIKGSSQMDRLPHHVALARSRTHGQLSPTPKTEKSRSQEKHVASTNNKAKNQAQNKSRVTTSISLQPSTSQSGMGIAAAVNHGNDKTNQETTRSKDAFKVQPQADSSTSLTRPDNHFDRSPDKSKVPVDTDAMASFEQNPLALQRTSGPPMKKMFGDGGWLGQNEADKKPILRSIWVAVKAKMHKTKPKMDMDVFKEIFAVRSQEPTTGMVTSTFMISCDPEFQSMIYARLDMLACTVANRFLMLEYSANRITTITAARFIERWVELGRAQFTEFNCGQPFQALIIWECREALQFHGDHDIRIRDTALDVWRKNANSMAVLTRCNGDSVIQKHLHDTWKIMELLDATWDEFESLSSLHVSFHDIVAAAKRRNDALGIPHDWNPPPVPETPAMLSTKTPNLAK